MTEQCRACKGIDCLFGDCEDVCNDCVDTFCQRCETIVTGLDVCDRCERWICNTNCLAIGWCQSAGTCKDCWLKSKDVFICRECNNIMDIKLPIIMDFQDPSRYCEQCKTSVIVDFKE